MLNISLLCFLVISLCCVPFSTGEGENDVVELDQDDIENIVSSMDTTREYLISTFVNTRNKLSGEHLKLKITLGNIVQGLLRRELDPFKVLGKAKEYFGQDINQEEQLLYYISTFQGCESLSNTTKLKFQNDIQKVIDTNEKIPALNLQDKPLLFIKQPDIRVIDYIERRLTNNKIKLTTKLLNGLLSNYRFNCMDSGTNIITSLIIQHFKENTISLQKFNTLDTEEKAKARREPHGFMRLIIDTIIADNKFENNILLQLETLLSNLKGNCEKEESHDNLILFLSDMRQDEFPPDIIEARDYLLEFIKDGRIRLPKPLTNINKYGLKQTDKFLALLTKLMFGLPKSNVKDIITAIHSHVQIKYLSSRDEFFKPKTLNDVNLLLNSFRSINESMIPRMISEVQDAFTSNYFNWQDLLKDFKYNQYGRPRTLFVSMLKELLKNQDKLKTCEIIVFNYFVDLIQAKPCKETLDPTKLHSSILPLSDNSSELISVECRNEEPVKIIESDSIVEILKNDSNPSLPFIIGLIKYHPIYEEQYKFAKTRADIFRSFLDTLKTQIYKDEVSSFVIGQAIFKLPLNSNSNLPPQYKIICPSEIKQIQQNATKPSPPSYIRSQCPVNATPCHNNESPVFVFDPKVFLDILEPTDKFEDIKTIITWRPIVASQYQYFSKESILMRVIIRNLKELSNQTMPVLDAKVPIKNGTHEINLQTDMKMVCPNDMTYNKTPSLEQMKRLAGEQNNFKPACPKDFKVTKVIDTQSLIDTMENHVETIGLEDLLVSNLALYDTYQLYATRVALFEALLEDTKGKHNQYEITFHVDAALSKLTITWKGELQPQVSFMCVSEKKPEPCPQHQQETDIITADSIKEILNTTSDILDTYLTMKPILAGKYTSAKTRQELLKTFIMEKVKETNNTELNDTLNYLNVNEKGMLPPLVEKVCHPIPLMTVEKKREDTCSGDKRIARVVVGSSLMNIFKTDIDLYCLREKIEASVILEENFINMTKLEIIQNLLQNGNYSTNETSDILQHVLRNGEETKPPNIKTECVGKVEVSLYCPGLIPTGKVCDDNEDFIKIVKTAPLLEAFLPDTPPTPYLRKRIEQAIVPENTQTPTKAEILKDILTTVKDQVQNTKIKINVDILLSKIDPIIGNETVDIIEECVPRELFTSAPPPPPEELNCEGNEILMQIVETESLVNIFNENAPKAPVIKKLILESIVPIKGQNNLTKSDVVKEILTTLKEKFVDVRVKNTIDLLILNIMSNGMGSESVNVIEACVLSSAVNPSKREENETSTATPLPVVITPLVTEIVTMVPQITAEPTPAPLVMETSPTLIQLLETVPSIVTPPPVVLTSEIPQVTFLPITEATTFIPIVEVTSLIPENLTFLPVTPEVTLPPALVETTSTVIPETTTGIPTTTEVISTPVAIVEPVETLPPMLITTMIPEIITELPPITAVVPEKVTELPVTEIVPEIITVVPVVPTSPEALAQILTESLTTTIRTTERPTETTMPETTQAISTTVETTTEEVKSTPIVIMDITPLVITQYPEFVTMTSPEIIHPEIVIFPELSTELITTTAATNDFAHETTVLPLEHEQPPLTVAVPELVTMLPVSEMVPSELGTINTIPPIDIVTTAELTIETTTIVPIIMPEQITVVSVQLVTIPPEIQNLTEVPPVPVTSPPELIFSTTFLPITENTNPPNLTMQIECTVDCINTTILPQATEPSLKCNKDEELRQFIDPSTLFDTLAPDAPKVPLIRHLINSTVVSVDKTTQFTKSEVFRDVLFEIRAKFHDYRILTAIDEFIAKIQSKGAGAEYPQTYNKCVKRVKTEAVVCQENERLAHVVDSSTLFDALSDQAPAAPYIRAKIKNDFIEVDPENPGTRADILREYLSSMKSKYHDLRILTSIYALSAAIKADGDALQTPNVLEKCIPHLQMTQPPPLACTQNEEKVKIIKIEALFDLIPELENKKLLQSLNISSMVFLASDYQNLTRSEVLRNILIKLRMNTENVTQSLEFNKVLSSIQDFDTEGSVDTKYICKKLPVPIPTTISETSSEELDQLTANKPCGDHEMYVQVIPNKDILALLPMTPPAPYIRQRLQTKIITSSNFVSKTKIEILQTMLNELLTEAKVPKLKKIAQTLIDKVGNLTEGAELPEPEFKCLPHEAMSDELCNCTTDVQTTEQSTVNATTISPLSPAQVGNVPMVEPLTPITVDIPLTQTTLNPNLPEAMDIVTTPQPYLTTMYIPTLSPMLEIETPKIEIVEHSTLIVPIEEITMVSLETAQPTASTTEVISEGKNLSSPLETTSTATNNIGISTTDAPLSVVTVPEVPTVVPLVITEGPKIEMMPVTDVPKVEPGTFTDIPKIEPVFISEIPKVATPEPIAVVNVPETTTIQPVPTVGTILETVPYLEIATEKIEVPVVPIIEITTPKIEMPLAETTTVPNEADKADHKTTQSFPPLAEMITTEPSIPPMELTTPVIETMPIIPAMEQVVVTPLSVENVDIPPIPLNESCICNGTQPCPCPSPLPSITEQEDTKQMIKIIPPLELEADMAMKNGSGVIQYNETIKELKPIKRKVKKTKIIYNTNERVKVVVKAPTTKIEDDESLNSTASILETDGGASGNIEKNVSTYSSYETEDFVAAQKTSIPGQIEIFPPVKTSYQNVNSKEDNLSKIEKTDGMSDPTTKESNK